VNNLVKVFNEKIEEWIVAVILDTNLSSLNAEDD